MKIIVHAPRTEQGKERIKQAVTEEHIRAVIQAVTKLNCPREQKQELLFAIAEKMKKDLG